MLIETAAKAQLHSVHVVLVHDNEEEKAFYDALDFEEEEGAVDFGITTATASARISTSLSSSSTSRQGSRRTVRPQQCCTRSAAEDDEEQECRAPVAWSAFALNSNLCLLNHILHLFCSN